MNVNTAFILLLASFSRYHAASVKLLCPRNVTVCLENFPLNSAGYVKAKLTSLFTSYIVMHEAAGQLDLNLAYCYSEITLLHKM